MRTELDVADLDPDVTYRLLTASVVPRPIAWVSTRSGTGVDNLAPHSFFTISCVRPPIVQFTSVGRKDSLANVEETGEFVVCLAPESLTRLINESATDFPREESEFDAVGIDREPSLTVAPSRVADSPVALECVLERTIELGDSTVVMGRVQHIAIDPSVVDDSDGLPHPRIDLMRPMSRLGRDEWGSLGDVRDIPREPYENRLRRQAQQAQ
ncbi:flavin reductase family protein [Luteipulveratus sp. YIM 133132]|uniref:Flavin reductase family protein n=1 Tax=Luteipulveratus flavus TaxID=3031728 RepID=A0ABT6C9F4_9MICO|nr:MULTISPECIES: flavin reductase family protein [unclassified Luteipulveratus]MDE9364976.1 flavin reductase family protein [Luteipulveratus sp. YIM 133132]MDF8264684.1 flavin reductase family protein [Luteipulveratus sp. YIM 133296]